MKKLVIYINTMNASGGIERVISNLLGTWTKQYSVTILVKDDMKSYYPIPKDVRIITISEPLVLDMNNRMSRVRSVVCNMSKTISKLRRFIKTTEFDYIYTVTPLNSMELYLASHKVMKKMVISEHASAFAVNGIYQMIKRYLYPKAYYVSVPNKMDCEVYRKWGCNTIYIPHPVTFFADKQNDLKSKIALNVGRYTSDKRQDLLIRCWARIKNKNGWKLWIVGEGEEKERLNRIINELGVSDSVILKPATKDIKTIYKNASLFIFTSRMEGFGMVLLEAMAFGIPCISFDCPSGPRDIVNEMNGFLIKNNDWASYKKIMEEVLFFTQEELNKYGEAAYSTVEQWDNDIIIDEWNKVFK